MSSAEAKPSRTRGKGDAAAAPDHSSTASKSQVDQSSDAKASAGATPHIEVKERTSVSAATIGAVEAVVFSAERALTPARIAAAVFHSSSRKQSNDDDDDEPTASAADQKSVHHAIEELNVQYERTSRSFRIESISGGYRVMTIPKYAEAVAAFKRTKQSTKLSKPAIETLAIIAYRQPITRAELEAIRGVACGEVLRSLVERKLVTITGRAEEVGRPMLYGTTKQFLDHFGLASIKDLPAPAEFAKLTS